jgi:hypothetical protein
VDERQELHEATAASGVTDVAVTVGVFLFWLLGLSCLSVRRIVMVARRALFLRRRLIPRLRSDQLMATVRAISLGPRPPA